EQSMTAFDSAFQAAAAMGITVCVASGDNGSSDGVNDGGNHVDFPASSPYVLACGGTTPQASGSMITGEAVWNDGEQGGGSGGGGGSFFSLPPRAGGGGRPPSLAGPPAPNQTRASPAGGGTGAQRRRLA